MKKLISIIVVLTMAFAFSITALAEDDVEVLPPVDPGWNEETGELENIDVELDEPLPPDVDGFVDGVSPEEVSDRWPNHDEFLLNVVEEYKNSDAYDEDVIFDAIQYIAEVWFYEKDTDNFVNPGAGGWITISNYFLGVDTIKAILHWIAYEIDGDDGYLLSEYRLITSDLFEYDPVTGTLRFYVDDLGFWSMFFALIERGVDPEIALQVANARSPKTEDTSIHAGIILLIVLSAATATVVISKKARKHD